MSDDQTNSDPDRLAACLAFGEDIPTKILTMAAGEKQIARHARGIILTYVRQNPHFWGMSEDEMRALFEELEVKPW